jgi:SAM-dependent methyltransferase
MPNSVANVTTWHGSALGAALLHAEAELLSEALDDVFGWELLQLGVWGPVEGLLGACRTRRASVLASSTLPHVPPHVLANADGRPASRAATPQAVARLSQLPIANAAVDAVLLPHTLEFETDPYGIVREADRVLAGEGQLLVLGFRPWGLWGMKRRASRRGFPPGIKRTLSERRVRDWLELLGYDVVSVRRYLYAPPWGQPARERSLIERTWLQPWPAGAYLLKARKRVYTLTPIRPRLRERPQVIGTLVKPTTRSRPEAG